MMLHSQKTSKMFKRTLTTRNQTREWKLRLKYEVDQKLISANIGSMILRFRNWKNTSDLQIRE